MQDKKLLRLNARPSSECGRERVVVVFDTKYCEYHIDGCLQPIGTYFTQHSTLNTGDTQVALILGMGQ